MKRVEVKAPFKIQIVLTDNGKSFTGYFTRAGERKPSAPPLRSGVPDSWYRTQPDQAGKPQMNGMLERFTAV